MEALTPQVETFKKWPSGSFQLERALRGSPPTSCSSLPALVSGPPQPSLSNDAALRFHFLASRTQAHLQPPMNMTQGECT